MWLCGFSLDNISLMALTVAVGFLVDDAIVVIENIVRHIEQGENPVEAALDGAKQIGFTVISISLSLVAVFIPILLMGGLIGRLFREFAVTLSASILVSAVVSLTLTPTLCGQFLRAQSQGCRTGFGHFLKVAEWLRARLALGVAAPFLYADADRCARLAATVWLYGVDAQRLLSPAGYRLDVRHDRSCAGHFLRRHGEKTAADRRMSCSLIPPSQRSARLSDPAGAETRKTTDECSSP